MWSLPSQAWALPTGTSTPEEPSWASPAASINTISSVPHWIPCAYQTNDVLKAMEADSGIRLAALKVDGGASANNYLMQTQSDIINAPVQRPQCIETTAMGAAYLAGLAVGYWKSKEDVIKNWAIDRTFEPAICDEKRKEMVDGWDKAVKYSFGWAK